MDGLSPANLFAYSAQIAALVLLASALPTALRLHSPGVRYAYWRIILVLCLALPWLQTPQRLSVTPGTMGLARVFATESPSIASASSVTWGLDSLGALIAVLTAGSGVRLLWLLVGWLRLRRLRTLGEPASEPGYTELQRAAGVHAEVRYIPVLAQPVMFGLARPVILLPDALRTQPDEIRHAVLAHELWHVRRRDWLSVVAEEVVRAAFWFHPAMWWVIARLRLAREEVVDSLAITLTGQRLAYVRALLTFADQTPVAPAPAFARRRHMFRRIVQISREDVMSSKRLVASCAVLTVVVATGSWYAIRAFPLMQDPPSAALQAEVGPFERTAKMASPDNPVPRRLHEETPVYPTDPAAREMSARVSVRVVIDQSGAVAETRVVRLEFAAENVRATIEGQDIAAKLLRFDSAAFRAKPGEPLIMGSSFRPLLEAFAESAVAAIRQWQYEPPTSGPLMFDTIVHFGATKPAPSVGAVQLDSPLADGAVRVGGNVKPPFKTRDVRPVYPPDAREARVQGVVILEVRIEDDGRVSQARVLRSIPMLDAAALDAVRQWEFTPPLLNGVPTPVVMTVTVQFMLQ